jgi:esterase/lipase superfamily enzyme
MMRKIHASLVQDLNPKNHSWFTDPRTYTGPRYDYWNPYEFKKMYQLEHLFKRVLTCADPDFDEIAEKSFNDFKVSQKSFGLPQLSERSARVIERARAIVHETLGEFDYNEFSEMCSFGKRAAAKLPYRHAYLDKRVMTLNGSLSQLEWFKVALCNDIHLHRACRLGLKQAEYVDSLELKAVPKSFKSARIIAPDTTVGGFLSRGLGSLIRKRLEASTHINLSVQQERHKTLARRASLDGYSATIDMSKASDSFVWEHVEALVPESWHDILKVVRTPIVTIGGEPLELKSYMLMGSGHTFPLQTLLFYSLCKAVIELMGSYSKVDVYGDDIIFPSQYAYYVIVSLSDLGFTVNNEKSFFEGPFRESCGGDYHTGVDVRPFMPEHTCAEITSKHEYTEYLHKWYNGLLARWTYEEIPQTCDIILLEIASLWNNLCPVPEEHPETAGLKYIPAKYDALVKRPITRDGITRYLCLTSRPRRRKPSKERAYYWYSLRSKSVVEKPTIYDEEANPVLDQRGREPVKGGSLWFSWVLQPKSDRVA